MIIPSLHEKSSGDGWFNIVKGVLVRRLGTWPLNFNPGFSDKGFKHRWLNVQYFFSKGLDMETYGRFNIGKRFFVRISLSDHNALET